MKDILALVTARGGSKGVPRKNVKLLGGKPLIAWSIEAAKQSSCIGRVVASTDDDEIAAVALQWGAEVPFRRPPELAEDASPHIQAAVHALEWLERNEGYAPEYVLLLQPTSPLRSTEDIEAAAAIAEAKDADGVVGVEDTHHHPYLAKRIADDGTLAAFVSTEKDYLRRQDLPPAYAVNGAIYLDRRDALLRENTFEPSRSYPYVMPPERSLQIDTPWDWFLIELVLEARRGT